MDEPLFWLGSSRDDVRAFPAPARRNAGFQLRRVQQGLQPIDWKWMPAVGTGVHEIRIHAGTEHRVFYTWHGSRTAFTSSMHSKNGLARPQNETSSRRGIDIETCSSRDGRKNMAKRKHRLARSSGNVFRDLGFSPEEAEHLLIRADLMIQIEKVLKERGLRQAQAAKLLRVTQPRVSDLLRGRIDLFSTDTLIDMLARLGIRVRLVTRRLRPSRVA